MSSSKLRYPSNGPTVRIQKLHAKGLERSQQETEEIRRWVKEYKTKPHARKETIEFYSV